ncbi:MAG TPA: helix-turn-helix transcriptional regulator [Candidatus Paceibacterota bacterium]
MKFKDYKKQQLETEDFKNEDRRLNLRFETSQLITEARLHKNLSQEGLAELVGTHQPSIARIESGATLPSLSFLERIAEAIGTYLIAPKFGFMVEAVTQIIEVFPTENTSRSPIAKGLPSQFFTFTSSRTQNIQHA